MPPTQLSSRRAQTQPDLKGKSFADTELAVNNSNFIKTYPALVGEKGKLHLMPRRGIALICWCVSGVYSGHGESHRSLNGH